MLLFDTGLRPRRTTSMAPLVAYRPTVHRHRSLPLFLPADALATTTVENRATKRPRPLVRRKQVRFEEEPPRVAVVPRSSHEMWISEAMFVRFALTARKKSDLYVENRPEYVKAIRDLGIEDDVDALENVNMLARSETRGLEQFVVPELRHYRKRAISHILLMQNKLRTDNLVNVETMGYLLRGKSKQLSQSSRQRAFRLAKSDCLAAKAIMEGKKR